jgi:2-methylisocitrate lyase-like PEP mutase family enzyme
MDPGIVVAPGVTNPLYARLAEREGFEAVFTTGAGIANTLLGLPDIGLVTLSEVVSATRNIVDAVHIPVIADIDTGYGNHLNVLRTVSAIEEVGAAGLFIEDQVAPKKCGHFEGKRVIGAEEMVQKIVAAVRARVDPDFVLIARTDALAVEGIDSAIRRGQLYAKAGADLVFVEAPRTLDELATIPPNIPVPCMANMVEGGLTPLVSAAELERFGFKLVVYANLALRVAARSVQRAFRVLRSDGSSAAVDAEIMPWNERQDLVGLPKWQEEERQILDASRRVMSDAEWSESPSAVFDATQEARR